jgi:hypothetical protein
MARTLPLSKEGEGDKRKRGNSKCLKCTKVSKVKDEVRDCGF